MSRNGWSSSRQQISPYISMTGDDHGIIEDDPGYITPQDLEDSSIMAWFTPAESKSRTALETHGRTLWSDMFTKAGPPSQHKRTTESQRLNLLEDKQSSRSLSVLGQHRPSSPSLGLGTFFQVTGMKRPLQVTLEANKQRHKRIHTEHESVVSRFTPFEESLAEVECIYCRRSVRNPVPGLPLEDWELRNRPAG